MAAAQSEAGAAEAEVKYKEAAAAVAQLQAHKVMVAFELDSLKDVVEEAREALAESRAELRRKNTSIRSFEREAELLKDEMAELRAGLKATDELKTENKELKSALAAAGLGITPDEFNQSMSILGLDSPIKAIEDERITEVAREENSALRDEIAALKAELAAASAASDAEIAALKEDAAGLRASLAVAAAAPTADPEDVLGEFKLQKLESKVKRLMQEKADAESTEDEVQREMRKVMRQNRRLLLRVEELEAELKAVH